ncbi:hypothetical protein [Caenibius tardaugens]|nr:hypothetical protein [Caenibius tardaugens]
MLRNQGNARQSALRGYGRDYPNIAKKFFNDLEAEEEFANDKATKGL